MNLRKLLMMTLLSLGSMAFLHAQVDEQDSLALVALYNSTDGPNWVNNTNWLTGPVSTWYGIALKNGRVRVITVGFNNLDGSIPSEIGNLTNLEFLYLNDNSLNGKIPSELGNLHKLKNLTLYNNELIGSIPPEIGNLINLESLRSEYNLLSGNIPPEIGNLSNLKRLSLDNNSFSGPIPSEIGNMSQLEMLFLEKNSFSGNIPIEIGSLNQLEILRLEDNLLSGSIPEQIGNLSNLERLRINGNSLGGSIPPQIGNLSNLVELYFNDNSLSGSVPFEISYLDQLTILFLNGNQLSEIQSGMDLSSIVLMDLSSNLLDFYDILPLLDAAPSIFSYGFQLTRPVVTESQSILSVDAGGDTWQWYKNGIAIPGATSNSYAPAEEANYYCQITHSLVSGLTLTSEEIAFKNDTKERAIILSDLNDWSSADALYNTIGAVPDQSKASCWINGPNNNVWFKFQASATGYIDITLRTGGNEGTLQYPYLALWGADNTQLGCERFVQLDDNLSIQYSGLIPNEWYFISADNHSNESYQGTFSISISDQVPPNYDFRSDALEFTDLNNWYSGDAEYTTIGATPDGSKPDCWTFANGPNYNRWFKFQATTNYAKVTMHTGNAEGNLRHAYAALWDTAGNEIDCAKFSSEYSDLTIESSSLTIGEWYYVSVDNFLGNHFRGTFAMSITDTAPAPIANLYGGTEEVVKTDGSNINDILIYPNPAQDVMKLILPGAVKRAISIQIIDLSGKVHLKRMIDQVQSEINIQQLLSGSYILKVDDGVTSYSRTIIKD